MRVVALPDGTEILAPSAMEAAVLYREIVTDRTYERHGITIRANDVVFDVGANVGVFAIHVSREVPGARVFAFEPVAPVFAALTRNLQTHAPSVRAFNAGLASAEGEVVFEFDPHMTLATTMDQKAVAGAANRTARVSAWAAAAFADVHRVRPNSLTRLVESFGPATRPAAALALGAPIALFLAIRRRLTLQRHLCRLTTLPRAMHDAGVDRIDMLKIDVEAAEESVIAGIDAETWPRIRQLAVEVHDVDGRLARLRRLLDDHGFATTVAREDWDLHALLGIHTLYGARP